MGSFRKCIKRGMIKSVSVYAPRSLCCEGDETKMIFGENVLESARTGLNLVNKMPEGNEAQRWGQMFGCFELACEAIGYLRIQNRELGKVIRDL